MTFAAEIEKTITDRATLVRIKPGRFVNSLLVSEGGGVYAFNMPGYIVNSLKRNGTSLTLVTLSSPTTNDTFSFNETTGRLAVKLASAPNSTTNILVAFYYLFYTSGVETEYNETPTNTATSLRYWNPSLIPNSAFSEYIDGVEVGVVSIPDASVELNNLGDDFRKYLTDNDSFSNKDIDIWHQINGEFRKAYTGKIKSLDVVSKTSVSISFSTQLSLLDKTAFLGDLFEECFHVSTTVSKKDLFKPITMIVGESYSEAVTSVGTPNYTIPVVGLSAVCTDYTPTVSTSTNRTWTVARGMGDLEQQVWTTIQAANPSAGTVRWRIASGFSGIYAGDTVKFEDGGNTYFATIARVEDYVFSSVTYNILALQVRDASGAFVGASVGSTSSVIDPLDAIQIIYKDPDGTTSFPCNELEYTVVKSATSGGNNLVKIELVNNFESYPAIGASQTVTPDTTDIQYVAKTAFNDNSHAQILKNILEKAGVTVNNASIVAAQAASVQTVQFSIPLINETEYSPYLVYVQKILESMLGYLSLNASGEIEYNLMALPSPAEERTNDQFLSDIFSSVEYRDIVTDIIFKNSHAQIISGDSVIGNKVESKKAKYLHETEKQLIFEHVLKPGTNDTISRQTELLAIRSNRKNIITYRTDTIDLGSNVGDDVTITDDYQSKDAFILSIKKSEDSTTVEATDLLGL